MRGLADTPLPLFAQVDGAGRPLPEAAEPPVMLTRLKDGREVVEDYRSVGLSLRRHPVSFLRETLTGMGMTTCGALGQTRDGRKVAVPGLVLMRQKPGTAKGVLFITIEDETGVANLIVWPSIFDRQRGLVMTAGMIACHGRVQREGEVIHVVTDRLEDLSGLLRSVGEHDETFPLRHRRGDGVTHAAAPDARTSSATGLSAENGIKVSTRDFR